MPSRTTNVVRFSGKSDKIATVTALLKGPDNVFDFNKLIPRPDWPTCNVANWGTKWPAYHCREPELRPDGKRVQYVFDTAWSCPKPIFDWLLNYTLELGGLDIEIWYSDEDGGSIYNPINDDFTTIFKEYF